MRQVTNYYHCYWYCCCYCFYSCCCCYPSTKSPLAYLEACLISTRRKKPAHSGGDLPTSGKPVRLIALLWFLLLLSFVVDFVVFFVFLLLLFLLLLFCFLLVFVVVFLFLIPTLCTSQSLFWASFGLVDLGDFDLQVIGGFTRYKFY